MPIAHARQQPRPISTIGLALNARRIESDYRSYVLLAPAGGREWVAVALQLAAELAIPLDAYVVGIEDDLATRWRIVLFNDDEDLISWDFSDFFNL